MQRGDEHLVTIRAISFDGISDDITIPAFLRLNEEQIHASPDSYQQLEVNYIFVSISTNIHFSNFQNPTFQ